VYTCVDNGCQDTYSSGAMPNQRDPEKKQLTVWRHESDMDVLREVAKANDISMSQLLEVLIEDFQDRKKSDQKKFLRGKRKE
jgi:predicted NBD/HSP70 family sugar kinase